VGLSRRRRTVDLIVVHSRHCLCYAAPALHGTGLLCRFAASSCELGRVGAKPWR
jgi:hypothetical protein